MTNDSTRQDGFCVAFPSFQLKPGFLDLTNNADGEMVFNINIAQPFVDARCLLIFLELIIFYSLCLCSMPFMAQVTAEAL